MRNSECFHELGNNLPLNGWSLTLIYLLFFLREIELIERFYLHSLFPSPSSNITNLFNINLVFYIKFKLHYDYLVLKVYLDIIWKFS